MGNDEAAPWLVVGLGNPGAEYAGNRHNVGFMAVERWLDRHWPAGIGDPWRDKFHGRYASTQGSFGRAYVLQPQTFMNRSGKSVLAAAQFFRVPVKQIVVVYDEIDFPFGRIAIKKGGGHGGHNGIRDMVTLLPSPDFIRVRVGVGRPVRGGDVSGWVLGNFRDNDLAELPEVLDRAEAAISAIVEHGVAKAMNAINQTADKPAKPAKPATGPTPTAKPASDDDDNG